MKILLFVNDTFFSYWLSQIIINNYYKNISLIIFSTKIRNSFSQLMSVYTKSSINYFAYRVIVQILSELNRIFKNCSVKSMAQHYNIPYIFMKNVNKETEAISKYGPFDLGITLNFDQIIKNNVLNMFKIGVINVHSSKLPRDKGISPVLWAFARGDKEIWTTVYKMDEGIDTGLILDQFRVSVEPQDTAFSLYERVCKVSGEQLKLSLDNLMNYGLQKDLPPTDGPGTYWSWPDRGHADLMKQNGKYFIKLSDIIRSIRSCGSNPCRP